MKIAGLTPILLDGRWAITDSGDPLRPRYFNRGRYRLYLKLNTSWCMVTHRRVLAPLVEEVEHISGGTMK